MQIPKKVFSKSLRKLQSQQAVLDDLVGAFILALPYKNFLQILSHHSFFPSEEKLTRAFGLARRSKDPEAAFAALWSSVPPSFNGGSKGCEPHAVVSRRKKRTAGDDGSFGRHPARSTYGACFRIRKKFCLTASI